jgi:hypothetical protein
MSKNKDIFGALDAISSNVIKDDLSFANTSDIRKSGPMDFHATLHLRSSKAGAAVFILGQDRNDKNHMAIGFAIRGDKKVLDLLPNLEPGDAVLIHLEIKTRAKPLDDGSTDYPWVTKAVAG